MPRPKALGNYTIYTLKTDNPCNQHDISVVTDTQKIQSVMSMNKALMNKAHKGAYADCNDECQSKRYNRQHHPHSSLSIPISASINLFAPFFCCKITRNTFNISQKRHHFGS